MINVVWSEFIEAIRKDVECTFGILKCRFQILKGIRFPEQNIIEATFVTCCIIHNMLLTLHHLDLSAWELDAAWDSVNMSPNEWDMPEVVVAVVEEEVGEEDIEVHPFAGLDYIDDEDTNRILTMSPQRNDRGNVSRTIALHEPDALLNRLVEHFS